MAITSTCPKCCEPVTIPDGLEERSRVRCPLCDMEYPLSDAMAAAPPALIPVRHEGLKADSDALLQGQLVTQPFYVDGTEQRIEAPQTEQETTAGEVGKGPLIDTGQAPVDTDALGSFAVQDSQEPQQPPEPVAGTPAKRPRKKRKQKSAGRQMIEAVVGGFGGLLIGYYLLCWFGPARVVAGLPKLPLPFLPHTMDWFAGGEEPGDTADKPANETAGPSAQKGPAAHKGPGPSTPLEQPDNMFTPAPAVEPGAESEPEPDALPPDYVGPVRPPVFTADQLGAALKEANLSIQGDADAVEMTPGVYGRFCLLGHALTFVEEQGPQLAARKDAAGDLLQALVDASITTGQVGGMAGALLESQHGGTSGVLLAGKVLAVRLQDGLYGALVELPQPHGTVTVMSRKPYSFEADDLIFLLGSVVEKEDFAGYDGKQERLIWAGKAVVLPQE